MKSSQLILFFMGHVQKLSKLRRKYVRALNRNSLDQTKAWEWYVRLGKLPSTLHSSRERKVFNYENDFVWLWEELEEYLLSCHYLPVGLGRVDKKNPVSLELGALKNVVLSRVSVDKLKGSRLYSYVRYWREMNSRYPNTLV